MVKTDIKLLLEYYEDLKIQMGRCETENILNYYQGDANGILFTLCYLDILDKDFYEYERKIINNIYETRYRELNKIH